MAPFKRHVVVVVFWAAVEHIVVHLLSALCRRAAVNSLLAGVPAVADTIAVERAPDRVHNKNSSLGMWQKLGCDKNCSWHWWQWYKKLWFGSCLAASFSAVVIIGVCVIVYARTKTTSYYSQSFVNFIGEQLHIYWWQLTCWARKVLILINHAADTLQCIFSRDYFHQRESGFWGEGWSALMR